MLKKILEYPMPCTGASTTRSISGVSLAHWLPRLDPAQRGIVGGSLHAGALNLVEPTIDQAAYVAHASSTYVWAASKLTPTERFLAWDGVLPLIAPKPTKRATPGPVTVVSDDEALVAIVARVGVDHALGVIAAAEVAMAA